MLNLVKKGRLAVKIQAFLRVTTADELAGNTPVLVDSVEEPRPQNSLYF